MTTSSARVSRKLASAAGLAVAAMFVVTVAGASQAGAAQAPVGLGTAGSFAVLAGTTVTNTGPSVINVSVGVSPGSAVTGFPPGKVTNKTIHRGDATAANVEGAVTTAYNDAAGRKPVNSVAVELGGRTLKPGIYGNPTLGITGTLTLDGQHNANAVFVFQTSKTLITAVGSKVALINGASACNVFWQVGSSATINAGSKFVGTVLALTSIGAGTGATIQGRLFARNGAVTLDTNTITAAACSIAPPVTTTTAPRPPSSVTSTTAPATTVPPTSAAATTTTLAPGVLNGTTGSPTTLSGTTVGGGGATIGSPKPLAATGANVRLTALAGLLALALGAGVLLGSRRLRASGPK